MIAVIVSPAARADLTEIIAYLASVASVGTASRWNDRLWLAFDEIAEFPGSGALRPKLGTNVRIKIVTPYIVIYEHVRGAKSADALRVVHGRRRITKRLVREQG